MTTHTTEETISLRDTFWAVGGAGVVLTLGALVRADLYVALSVGFGAVIAVANLWVISRLVHVYLFSDGLSWALVGALKMVVLAGAVYLLATRGLVAVLPLMVGYAALPVGIVASKLRPTPRPALGEEH